MTLTAVGCGSSAGGKPAGGAPTMKLVGASGGALTSSDGNLNVNIPAGALPGDVTITTEPAAAPAAGAVGSVYEIGPTGTQFAMPVTLTLHYDASALSGASESSLRVATYANGAWQLLPGAVVDTQAKTVSGVTTHLSPYGIVTEAAGKTCATVQTNYGCTQTGAPAAGGSSSGGSSSGGPSSGGTDVPDAGTGGGATCQAPTCAGTTNICAPYPGAAMDSCVDGANGFTAQCCFPSNAPICFAIAGAGSTCTGGPGGGAPNCPPPPTCASATAQMACAGYPGASLQNCTDTAGGFTGACCFAPDARVCVSTGAGRACASSTGGSGGPSCPPPPRCSDGNPCAGWVGATADSCTESADGFQATCCFAPGSLPIASGGGSSAGGNADGGAPAVDAGAGTGGPDGGMAGGSGTTGAGGATGAGAASGGGTCAPGASCTQGYRCDPGSTTSCTVCMCGADGTLACGPCGGGTGAGGAGTTGAGATSGGGTCAPGATCTPGYQCDPGSTTGCTVCMCGADGTLACGPCGGGTGAGGAGTTGGGGATGAGATSGGGTCAPGATCTPGSKCDPGSTTGCMVCMCGADGTLACGPCGGGTGAGGTGTTGAGGSSGATGPCQVNSMPSTSPGTPCGVMETCPDGSNYRVRCDGSTGACTCFMNGSPGSTMPTMSCTGFDPMAALVACGFPDGKI